MRSACLHTHTDFCDGADSIDAMCRAAYERGLCTLGFSAHAPVPFASNWHLPQDRLREYVDAVHKAAAAWRGKLRVLLGLEIDYIEGMLGPADGRFSDLGLDYAIGSVHYLVPDNGAEPFTVDGPYEEWERGVRDGYGGDGEAAAEAYWRAQHAMIRAGGFDIIGHFDLIKKNNGAGGRKPSFDTNGDRYRSAATEAVRAAAAAGLIVEVNTGALNRGSLAETYPSPWLLTCLCEAGGRVTINADAHRADHVNGHYDEARRTLIQAGFSETYLFDGIGWEREPLA